MEDYYDALITEVKMELSSMFLGKRDTITYKKLARIVDETEIFVKSFSVPGIVERWAKINQTLYFYDCVYDVMNEINPELIEKLPFPFIPTPEQRALREQYFRNLDMKNRSRTLRYTRDRQFQNELINTLEKVFEHDFWGKEE